MPLKVQSVPLAVGLLILGLVSCSQVPPAGLSTLSLGSGQVTKIRVLQERQPAEKVVYLQGQVSRQVPLVNQQAYELKDSTGSIWVVTQENAPNAGKAVTIKGKVRYQSIPVGTKDLGEIYIEEQQQL